MDKNTLKSNINYQSDNYQSDSYIDLSDMSNPDNE